MTLMKLDDSSIYMYQYDGVAAFKDILSWCQENIDSKTLHIGNETIWISGDEAATLFALRWA